MRHALIALSILLGAATPTMAQVSVTVAIPGVSIGINQPVYPELVLVPGYPVYYAPHVQANYFFYDGLYWVYQDDRWYMSSWYNGPWDLVEPDDVPLFVLRVPVQYYVRPPVYFSGWVVTSAPLWHVYWGPRWTHYRPGWDHWDRRVVYRPAPLPVYQRHYAGDHYPRREYQRVIRREHYHYQPRDRVVRRHDQQRAAPRPQVHAQPNRPDAAREQRPQRERGESSRNESRRDESRRDDAGQRAPAAQEQRQPSRQEPERRAQPQPQRRPDVPRAQPAPREREDAPRPEAMQLSPQQRAAMMQERQQQRQERPHAQQAPKMQPPPRPQQVRPQQAPRPQQAQERQPRGRGGDAHQSRGHAERRQGPERGGDR
jgi:hypothetical protein